MADGVYARIAKMVVIDCVFGDVEYVTAIRLSYVNVLWSDDLSRFIGLWMRL